MKLEQSPLSAGWWGTGLENVGLKDQRPDVGTYGCYDFANLPPLPIALQDDFAWLADAPAHASHIGLEYAGAVAETLPTLLAACDKAGVVLPGSFMRFMQTPRLHAPIRPNTDCFLDLPDGPVASPVGDGALCDFWRTPRAVCSSTSTCQPAAPTTPSYAALTTTLRTQKIFTARTRTGTSRRAILARWSSWLRPSKRSSGASGSRMSCGSPTTTATR
jgi:hypothetical protein